MTAVLLYIFFSESSPDSAATDNQASVCREFWSHVLVFVNNGI